MKNKFDTLRYHKNAYNRSDTNYCEQITTQIEIQYFVAWSDKYEQRSLYILGSNFVVYYYGVVPISFMPLWYHMALT